MLRLGGHTFPTIDEFHINAVNLSSTFTGGRHYRDDAQARDERRGMKRNSNWNTTGTPWNTTQTSSHHAQCMHSEHQTAICEHLSTTWILLCDKRWCSRSHSHTTEAAGRRHNRIARTRFMTHQFRDPA